MRGSGASGHAPISELQAVPGVAAVTLTELTPFGDGFKNSITA